MDTLIGKTLSHYRIVEKIGAGGMGEVYRASDTRLERDVALKVLPSGTLADDAARKRFRREALALSKLNHPNIATVHDFDAQEGMDFLVMEYVAGATVGEKLHAGPSAEKEIARLGVELAEGLAAAHGQGVIHRDLKPGNVRLTPDGRLKILDFGLARLVQRPGATAPVESLTQTESLTQGKALVGTLPYMAPEQLRGERVDARSDIWAAGLVLYELATGRRAFPEVDSARLIASILQEAPPSPSGANRQVSPGLDSIVAKCLEKDPESRYQSAKELAVDLRRLGVSSPGLGAREVRETRRRRWFVATAGAVAAIAVGLLAWSEGWLPGPHRHASAPGKKDWILVAEFEGPAGDSTLAVTTRDLVSAALDQSEIVATVPQDQIRLALEAAGKPKDSRVGPELARELAYRSAVRAVLEGKIGRLGRGYSVVLRVVDAESLKVVLTESTVAKNEDALIPTLGRLAKKLRAGLGENRGAIQATRDMGEVATPSFEAYRLYVHARRDLFSLANRDVVLTSRDVLALDPDFAMAWSAMGMAFYNLGQPDSALAAYEEALRRPQRLTTVQRLNIQALRASTQGDLPAALDLFGRVLQYDPTNRGALMNGAIAYADLGRFEEALESTRRAERASPFEPNQGMRNNEVVFLCELGRVNEAREIARHVRGPESRWTRVVVEIAATNWAAAERIADSLLADPGPPEDERAELLLNLASARAARGALKGGAATFAQTEEVVRAAGLTTIYAHAAYRGRMMLAIVSRGTIPLPADAWARDSSAASFITRGLRAAIAGDRPGAQRLLSAARRRPGWELAWQGAAPALLQAQIEALAGRWGEAAAILAPVASQRVEIGEVSYQAGMSAVRWLLADALEKLGQPDSAAACLERVTSDPAPAIQERGLRGIALPFAHRRLVMLYVRMGRLDDARRHWKMFTETVRTPDPEIRPLIEETRAALAKAEEVAGRRASGT